MKNIAKFFKPNLKLVKGSRLTSALFIGTSIALAAGIIFGANIYYDIDTSKIIVGDTQQSTTTQITVDTANSTALTITQRGTAAAVSVTSTNSMTADIFKISNLGAGKSFVVEDSDTDTISAFVVDADGKVGVASTTPSDTLGVQGNIMGSGNIFLYGAAANVTSTFSHPIQVTRLKVTEATAANLYLKTTDTLGNTTWASLPTSVWTESGTNVYPASEGAVNVAISTTTARYDLDVWGDFAVGTSTDYATPAFFINSGEGGRIGIGTTTLVGLLTVGTSTPRFVVAPDGYVGVATSTPSDTFAVQGNIMGSGNIFLYGSAANTTSTFSHPIQTTQVKITGPTAPSIGQVLTATDVLGNASWQSTSGITPSNWSFVSVNAIRPSSTNPLIGIIVNASSTFTATTTIALSGLDLFRVGNNGQFYIDASGNATTSGNIYASAFISTGNNAYTRKVNEEIVRGVAPILGFDLPVRCNTTCIPPNWATTTRTIENTDFFPSAYTGTTRKYRFSIRYASASSTASSVWQVATSSDNSSYQFTLNATGDTDIDKGFSTTTNLITSLPDNGASACGSTNCWFLRTRLPLPNGGWNFQVYEILLIGIDQVN